MTLRSPRLVSVSLLSLASGCGNQPTLMLGSDLDPIAVDASLDSAADGPDEESPDQQIGGLDPNLSLPDQQGASCIHPGIIDTCGGFQTCRIATETSGRCEDYSAGGLDGEPCLESVDCQTVSQCYAGHCRIICPFDGSWSCPVGTCQSVGHNTHGLCLNSDS